MPRKQAETEAFNSPQIKTIFRVFQITTVSCKSVHGKISSRLEVQIDPTVNDQLVGPNKMAVPVVPVKILYFIII